MAAGGQVEFVRLTGQPRAQRGQDELSFLPDKRFQLLTYLAYNSGWVGRERAAFLFWPDSDTADSRRNLRALLQRLHTLPFDPGIQATKHHLRWDVPTDVAAFEEAVERGDIERALSAYQGPLLDGLEGDDPGEFGEWLEITRQHLHSRWRSIALSRLAETEPSEALAAESLVRRLLEIDPLDEEAVCAYLLTLARIGRPAAGRALYREFEARLERELGIEPTSETTMAFEALQRMEASPGPATRPDADPGAAPLAVPGAAPPSATTPAEGEPLAAPAPEPRHPTFGATAELGAQGERRGAKGKRFDNLPAPSTTFIGREAELAEIVDLLSDPACRLLSLMGPGGVGKTRLALAAAERLGASFADGTLFVPLDVVTSPEEVLPALAFALGLTSAPGDDLLRRVADALADAQVLLVIDNFEHVIAAADHVPRLLAAAPGMKVLATTRERLGVGAEWTYPVQGLDYPHDAVSVSAMSAYGAVRLLVERARRVRPSFKLAPEDLPALERLCSVTKGLPLAIELAAAWLRAVPLATLVRDLADDLDLLTATTSDALTRHGSIRGIFEQSWARISEVERSVMRRMAVFRSAVTPEAAMYVAGATRATLAALIDKSLLSLDEGGRYDRHPLLLAFAREKLGEAVEERNASERRHAAYHLHFLRERSDKARGPRPARALQEIDAEIREIRAAVRRARERGKSRQLVAFMQLLELETGYFQAHGHSEETLEALSEAADAAVSVGKLDVGRDLRGRLGDAYGIHRGDVERALHEYRAAAQLARRSGNPAREAVFVSLCGVMLARHAAADPATGEALGGDTLADAWDELDRALAMARATDDRLCLSTVLEHRAYVLALVGDFLEARHYYLESLEAVAALAGTGTVDPYELARRRFFATVNLGAMDHQLGRFDDALAARHDGLRIADEMGNPIWSAHVHLELGEMYSAAGEHRKALEHLRLARSLYRENHVTAQLSRIQQIADEQGYELSGTS